MSSTEIATLRPYEKTSVEEQERLFELAQRKAKIYTQSDLVPKTYKDNVGNVLIAENMAKRMGADTLMVMQNLYIVHGNPGWSAQFLIACFNTCGRFSAIRYELTGKEGSEDRECVAYCTELSTGERIEGSKVSISLAKAEGWHGKNGSKWKTMPEQMLRYRAATFLIRTTAPEIGMGLLTQDELTDIGPQSPQPANSRVAASTLNARLANHAAEPDEPAKDPVSIALERIAAATTPIEIVALDDDYLGPDSPLTMEQSKEVSAAINKRREALKAAAAEPGERVGPDGELFDNGGEGVGQ